MRLAGRGRRIAAPLAMRSKPSANSDRRSSGRAGVSLSRVRVRGRCAESRLRAYPTQDTAGSRAVRRPGDRFCRRDPLRPARSSEPKWRESSRTSDGALANAGCDEVAAWEPKPDAHAPAVSRLDRPWWYPVRQRHSWRFTLRDATRWRVRGSTVIDPVHEPEASLCRGTGLGSRLRQYHIATLPHCGPRQLGAVPGARLRSVLRPSFQAPGFGKPSRAKTHCT